jgi:hypothetical protein
MESSSGLAVASLGQIVEGYVAVFGMEDRISLRSLEKNYRRTFLRFLRAVRQRVEQRFGPTLMFEHGASCVDTDVSCGVNQIHVHIVPYAGRALKSELKKLFRCTATFSTIEEMLEDLACWHAENPYFWLEEHGHISLFSYGVRRESQVVRRVLAKEVGMPECWNWREYPTHESAKRVAKELLNASPQPFDPLQTTLV